MAGEKVELLSPAGNYQTLVGAINAGADAVYLGGDRFSARAYADNFTKEELLKAIRYTHICGKKLYLTLNTLVKEKEFSSIYDYLSPLYEAGLDGIIIQDLGVLAYVKENFPDLALHASTQMTITGAMGAAFLKQSGAVRIVPARELSLKEIKNIKRQTGLEIECFIHGAMCYSYSGQCLFSSILGGRSGNRGRCAQPCRLPYKVSKLGESGLSEEIYPLSLKDMCTIEYIPQLIEAGIDSFKIEGRMKKPEYAAGVTSIYRKYIDRYYNECYDNKHYDNKYYDNKYYNNKRYQNLQYTNEQYDNNCRNVADLFQVDKSDMDKLYKLYIRSDVQNGYYERYNGKEMITIGKGSYLGSDEALLKEISEKYLKEEKKISVKINGDFKAGEAAELTIESMSGIIHTSHGEIVQQAMKRPMNKDDILKQLSKTGNSNVKIDGQNITVGENIFIPIAQLNELRRNTISAFEDKVIEANGLAYNRKMHQNLQNYHNTAKNSAQNPPVSTQIHVAVQTIEQLQTVCQYTCSRIYIDSDLYISCFDQISQHLEIYPNFAIYLSLPYIIREKDTAYLEQLARMLNKRIKGFLVRNLEAVYWVLSLNTKYSIVTDCGVYCFNAKAVSFLTPYADECYLPWELNGREQRQLIDKIHELETCGMMEDIKISMPVYGTIPMMITANCVKKTTDICNHDNLLNLMYLTDRYNTKFPVLCNCKHCYNIIYNSVPYSLHHEWKNLRNLRLFAIRLDFVFENNRHICEILDYYTGKSDTFPVAEYTSGHYKRGVN